MKQAFILLLPLLLTQSFDVEANVIPRKANFVTKYLDKILNSLFLQLATSEIIIPEVDLGEEIGNFTDIEIKVLGNGERELDGILSYGFKLFVGLTKIRITGNYDIIHLDVPGLFPFYGKGKFSIFLGLAQLDMKLTADYSFENEKYDIEIPNFVIIVENSTVNFENLMDDTHLSDFLNELLSNLLPYVVDVISKPLIDVGKPLIDYYGNGIIKCIKLGALLGNIEKCIKELFFPPEEIQDVPKLSNILTKYLKP